MLFLTSIANLAAAAAAKSRTSELPSSSSLLEGLAFPAFVALYIWRLQLAHPVSWFVFPVWLLVSFVAHHDTPKTLGWRIDNLWSATRNCAPIFLVSVLGLLIIGAALGAFQRTPAHFLDWRRFSGYLFFCALQQLGLQSLTMNRLLAGLNSPILAAATAGILFGALHWPNPVLVPLTTVAGAVMCWLFAKERNIFPLAIIQAILGALVWWAFPLAWHHSMRVGPGFYTYVLH